jgi:hypothetical protein
VSWIAGNASESLDLSHPIGLIYPPIIRRGFLPMQKAIAQSLRAIAVARKGEVERILEGIHGIEGSTLWTKAMRPSIRKDDPPEDE